MTLNRCDDTCHGVGCSLKDGLGLTQACYGSGVFKSQYSGNSSPPRPYEYMPLQSILERNAGNKRHYGKVEGFPPGELGRPLACGYRKGL